MPRDPKEQNAWSATVADLAKLEGRHVMGPGRMQPGPQHHGKCKREADTGLSESRYTGEAGALLD